MLLLQGILYAYQASRPTSIRTYDFIPTHLILPWQSFPLLPCTLCILCQGRWCTKSFRTSDHLSTNILQNSWRETKESLLGRVKFEIGSFQENTQALSLSCHACEYAVMTCSLPQWPSHGIETKLWHTLPKQKQNHTKAGPFSSCLNASHVQHLRLVLDCIPCIGSLPCEGPHLCIFCTRRHHLKNECTVVTNSRETWRTGATAAKVNIPLLPFSLDPYTCSITRKLKWDSW